MEYIIFAIVILHEDRILKINYQALSYQELLLKEEVVDYAQENSLYVLTPRNIYSIDTANFRIVDRTPLPQKFNYLTIGPEEIYLITTSEIVVLNKRNLSFKTGIGIEPADYQPMVAPIQLSNKNLIYLIANNEGRSIIKVIDRAKEKKVKGGSFTEIKKSIYNPEEKNFIMLTNSGLHFLDANLKIKKSLKCNIPGDDLFIHDGNYIITNRQGIYAIDRQGKIIDFQPVLLSPPVQHVQFYFFNRTSIIFIDPLTLRVKWMMENEPNIYRIYPLVFGCSIGINSSGELFLLDNKKGQVINLVKEIFEVSASSVASAVQNDSLFYLQFGAFTDPERATEFSDHIRVMGIPVFIDLGEDNLYRIKLGGFVEKNLAREFLENLNLPGWLIFQKKFTQLKDTTFYFSHQEYRLKDGIIMKGVVYEENNQDR